MKKKEKAAEKTHQNAQKERRKESRVHTDLRVKIFAGGEYFAGVSKNLSCGGVLVRAPKEILGKDLERLSIAIPENEEPKEVDAEVAWSGPLSEEEAASEEEVNIGFQFKDLDEEVKEQIQEYIKKFLNKK